MNRCVLFLGFLFHRFIIFVFVIVTFTKAVVALYLVRLVCPLKATAATCENDWATEPGTVVIRSLYVCFSDAPVTPSPYYYIGTG